MEALVAAHVLSVLILAVANIVYLAVFTISVMLSLALLRSL